MHSSKLCDREERIERRRRRKRTVSIDPQWSGETGPSANTVEALVNLWTLQQGDASTPEIMKHMTEHKIPMGYAHLFTLIQNIPLAVLMSNPVILFDAFSQQPFAFSLDMIGSLSVRPLFVTSILFADTRQAFKHHISERAKVTLEDRFQDGGSAKFLNGEFQLRDRNQKPLDLRLAWNSLMNPGDTVYISVKFHENNATSPTTCPRCRTENKMVQDQDTVW